MKISNFKFKAVVLVLGLLFSCESTELDLTESPNALSPEQASADFFLNAVQEDFGRLVGGINGFGDIGAQLTRVHYMGGRQYNQNYSADSFNNEWSSAYAGILADLNVMYGLAEEANLQRHLGIGRTIEAFTIVTLVDFFGDIPYTEALQGAEGNFNPSVDSGASIYDAALALLDQADAAFTADTSDEPEFDLFYDNDYDNWQLLTNSLRIKILNQRRLVDPGAVAAINTIIASGDFISDSSEDFQFQWGANLANPDTRSPQYAASYINTGAAEYMSNSLMDYMMSDKVGNASATFEGMDPRIRYYFYRQNAMTPGVDGAPPSQQELQCSVESPPQHYVDGGFTYCNLANGYWGRDHGDDDGIPPDGLLRTVWGVYPFGGRFDDSTFDEVDQGIGAGGAGVTPIFLSSTIDFIRAELAMEAGNTADARTFMLAGIAKSFTKVRSFGALDSGADLSTAAPLSDDTDYMTEVGELFDAADTNGKWNILATEFFVTLFGNGIDAYNFYRRVGAPFDLQPNLEPDPGAFIRSHFYPGNLANNNSNVTQKSGVTDRVFWDTNPETGFPIAN
ncbi:SusD/RagB family nutrient-binding outer membrane lipoprotein [Leptobacterium flavescens]|uniref:SusD/RagB family nutrient-binding outer membrane lipoprotein n=1 Tax=Leptobacterium flavescens TaxID=472055 RepID=A0A6P0UT43_9FLAO|nr:SusD/RagB family nutrient-binding outer membrane lipoprotein [Leptobacterium flavescens]NER15158.1 SusD/RagB family nutrient-binding outer membrane lipoprotein [Leptobacterium flavescens]